MTDGFFFSARNSVTYTEKVEYSFHASDFTLSEKCGYISVENFL